MSATTYDVPLYPAYQRSSFPPSMAAVNSSHLSPLFDVSPLLYPPTPMRDVSSSSTTFFPNDATQQPQQQQQQQQRFTTVAQHMQSEHFTNSSLTSASSTISQLATGSQQQQQQHNLSAFLSSLSSSSAPHSPLSIQHPPNTGSYFDYSDTVTHSTTNGRSDPLSFTHQQQLLHHRILQQQLQAKAAVAVPASPVSVQSDMNSVSGGSAHDLFPSDSASSHSSQSPQQLSSVSSMSTPPPLQSSTLPPTILHSHSHSHSHSHAQSVMQPQPQPQPPDAMQPSLGADGKKRKGVLSRKIACNVCHLAKTSCDGARPCSRCVRLLKTSQCVDRPSKMAKNKASTAIATTAGSDDTSAAVAAGGTSAAVAPAPAAVDGKGELHSRAAGEQPSASPVNHSRQSLSAVVEDVDIDDEHNDSDRSLPHSHSHSGDEWCDDASDHSAFSSDDDSDSSLHSDSSLNFEAHVSRSLLRAHINWINKQHDDASTNPTRRMDLREKLVYFTWIRHMMQPEDVEQIIHYSEVYHRNERGEVADVHNHSLGRLKRPLASPPIFRRRRGQPYQPCDGRVCNNFCPTARDWATSNPVVFTWHQSPEMALVDSPHSHAVLVCRGVQDPVEVEQQNRRIVANTLMLRDREKVRQRLAAETTRISPVVDDGTGAASPGATGAPQSASSGTDGSGLHVEDTRSYDAIINMCGVSAEEQHRLHTVIELQRREAEKQHVDAFTTLVLRSQRNPTDSPTDTDEQANTGSSSSASSSSSSSSLTLQIAPVIEMALSVQVNPAFERLFGFSQAELRQQFIRDGGKALYGLTRRDDWEKLMELDQEAVWGREQEYRTYAVIVNKWRAEVPCLVHTVYEMNNDGKFKQTTTSFIPLPDAKPPTSSSNKEEKDSRSRRRRQADDSERERSRRRKEADRHKSSRGGRDGGDGGKDKRREREGKRS